MFQAIFLIALGAMGRLIPHFWLHDAWNLVPMGAIALFAGSRLSTRIAWSVPVFGMILSDIVLDQRYGNYFDSPTRWLTYATLAVIALMGLLATGSKPKVFRLAGLSLAGSTLFFLMSNFGCWAWPEGVIYPHTIAGLVQCYVAAIPFFKNSVLADLIGTAVLFGLAPAVAHGWHRLTASVATADPADLTVSGVSATR